VIVINMPFPFLRGGGGGEQLMVVHDCTTARLHDGWRSSFEENREKSWEKMPL
jgi:hypothetical protein